jgi:hypothetical protein
LFVFVLRAGKAQLKSAYKELFSIITMTNDQHKFVSKRDLSITAQMRGNEQ